MLPTGSNCEFKPSRDPLKHTKKFIKIGPAVYEEISGIHMYSRIIYTYKDIILVPITYV